MSGEEKTVRMSPDERVGRYLAEVDAALAARGVADRAEIVADLREHVEAALGEGEGLEAVLASLGDPQAIAAEAERDAGPPRPAPYVPAPVAAAPVRRRRAWPAVVALGLVVLGSLLVGLVSDDGVPVAIAIIVLGWVGIWASPLWRTGEQLFGTLLVPAPGIVVSIALNAFTGGAQSCETVFDGTDTQTVCQSSGADGSLGMLAIGVPFVVVGLAYLVLLARLAVVRARGS
ncbi:putative membrane protein [Nocardioides zeae]|uniref:Membrane protein n=2 Tax=Nocardioides zeae TaxID=1457234 RepID=A0AAJ1X3A7_9ACTN|nr:hypothetical protein [Nocardioides zeae]MDQ1106671.1 putative membrane protein [Nocardioides zeae]MDR6173667.1 putative membrane protein [Nocardioides zeae]MDR6211071.1 putative membrane protein [Nocardioides zeae]